MEDYTFSSHDTALCLLPPQHVAAAIDGVRSLYDKAYGTWPPHINLWYPFVRPELLADAAAVLSRLDLGPHRQLTVRLGEADSFTHKTYNTIFLRPNQKADTAALTGLRDRIRCGLTTGTENAETTFQPHLTVGQSEDAQSDSHKFLVDKMGLLAPVEWPASQIAILKRHGAPEAGPGRRMRVWGYLDMATGHVTRCSAAEDARVTPDALAPATPQPCYQFIPSASSWQATQCTTPERLVPQSLIVASYNVLAEFEWPPSASRYPHLISNLLSSRASADVLLLQEVTDHFLPVLLAHEEIRSRYPYATHGPPDQQGIGPLPSLLNIVVLSRYQLEWEYLPMQRKHKACAVVTLPSVGIRDGEDSFFPWVIAACHLSQGLADGAVVAKKNEVQRVLDHLSTRYRQHPWILAGDFNLATSSYTINTARRKQDISSQTVQYLRAIDQSLAAAGFQDTWLSARLEAGESSDIGGLLDVFEGEQGATFNPLANALAADLVGSGLNNRPQRYDRILARTNGQFQPRGFNLFGQDPSQSPNPAGPVYASDHWGVRCLLVHNSSPDATPCPSSDTRIDLRQAPTAMSDTEGLKKCLQDVGYVPSDIDRVCRERALEALQRVLLENDQSGPNEHDRSGFNLVLAPVGSYGLGVWTRSSDLDCLCIGNISTRTFFALAIQRLRRASSEGIKIIRRVKATSGQMLELEIHGIKADLQYCAATAIIERWPEVMKRPSHDDAFNLPFQTLSKLKPLRDLFYLRRSIPDLAQYRLAHLLIKAWAKSRGIYSAKFGFLGGIHISVLLVPVCKALARNVDQVSSSDLITTFFNHYANFDWKASVVFDPFFHKTLRYNRSFREPLCLLGWHSPSLNTALNASVPTVNTIAAEFSKADALLSEDGMTWDAFLGLLAHGGSESAGATAFLHSHKAYVKVDAHYWGPSSEKGCRFIGWLESRCVMLLVDMDKKVSGLASRIWPARFVDEPHTEGHEMKGEFHTCFLIGLEWSGQTVTESSKDQAKSAQGALSTVLADFEGRIRGDEKYYDAASSWMTASVVRGAEVGDLQLDNSSWAGFTAESDSDDSDDDLDLDDVEDGIDDDDEATEKKRKKGGSAQQRVAKPIGVGKFRTAADVMNRLRWDENLDSSDFMVGYEDRFIGACEKALEQWKSEQTDEEFIPQHRILYFKRKSDGEVLWERRTWTDKIFNKAAS